MVLLVNLNPVFYAAGDAWCAVADLLAVSIIHYSWQFFNHNALTPKLGWLEKVLITPSHHRVHHLNQKQYADTNYGGTFLLWDKLFGSYSAGPEYDVGYGVKK